MSHEVLGEWRVLLAWDRSPGPAGVVQAFPRLGAGLGALAALASSVPHSSLRDVFHFVERDPGAQIPGHAGRRDPFHDLTDALGVTAPNPDLGQASRLRCGR